MSVNQTSWEFIGCALRSLLYKYDIDLSNIGKVQRLEYQDFEKIFYHLAAMIDPTECRKKFWSLYPARDNEERSKFINETVQFINSKSISSTKVSASQLRMCGGEPFRRLLKDLIFKAAETEITAISKRTPECLVDSDLDCKQTGEVIRERLNVLKNSEEKLETIHEQLDEMETEINAKWESQVGEVFVDQNNSDRMKEIHKALVSRLEKTYERCKVASKQIKELPKPPESVSPGASSAKIDGSKRMSHLFKEMRQRLTLSPDFTPETSKAKLINKITQRLFYYDNGIDNLISTLEVEREKADEALLRQPEMMERYNFFKSVVPFIDIKPISFGKSQTKDPKLSDVGEILNEFLDPKYHDDKLISHIEKNFPHWK